MEEEETADALGRRTQRSDARRNHDRLVAAARDTFAQDGVSASLEQIARRAQVGIGTLYRHFPCRADLFERAYTEEVDDLCRVADELADRLPPWDALVAWLHRFVDHTATKRALAQALNHDTELFQAGRGEVHAAGERLLRRAQAAGVVRPEPSFDDVIRMVGGMTLVDFVDAGQRARVVALALDGLRYALDPVAP